MRRPYRILIACAFMLVTAARGVQADAASSGDDDGATAATEVRSLVGVPISFEFATREEGHELRLVDVHLIVVCPVAGRVFQGVSEGPFLVAALPDGRYDIVASHEGRAQRVALTVARGEPRSVTLYW